MVGQGHSRGVNTVSSFRAVLPFDKLPVWDAFRRRPLAEQLAGLKDTATRASLEDAVINAVYFSVPESTVRLTALALSAMRREGGLIWATVSNAQMNEARATDEAADDTIKTMQRVAGMRVCALFRVRREGTVMLCLRSVPGINVAAIAQTWGGGGHIQAAGATLPMSLAEAPDAVLPLLRAALGQA